MNLVRAYAKSVRASEPHADAMRDLESIQEKKDRAIPRISSMSWSPQLSRSRKQKLRDRIGELSMAGTASRPRINFEVNEEDIAQVVAR